MSQINATSLAATTAVGLTNTVINYAESILTRKIVLIGVADATKLSGDLAVDTPIRVFSAGQVGQIAGAGSMIHRLAIASEKTSNGVETWIIPQAEGGSDVVATGTITVTTTTALSGVIPLYINGVSVPVSVVGGSDATTIADAISAAVTKNSDLPVSATNTLGVVTLTAKNKGAWGNDISITTALSGESAVGGVSLAIVDMASGAGVSDITTALAALGAGDNANELGFTALQHGYGNDTATLNAISQYVGEGNSQTGCYDKVNGRFFRSLVGSVANDLPAEITIADGRKLDRANGVVCVPNSPNHPIEIATTAMGAMESINANLAIGAYFNVVLPGVFPGASNWTDEFDNRDLAVKSGISPTITKSGAVVLQNVVTFYRPDDVPVANNGYRSMRNISISQNVVYIIRQYFEQENWQNITIVKDAGRVTSAAAKRQVKDIDAVKNAIFYLGGVFANAGFIFSTDSVIEGLAKADSVTLRSGGTGFDYKMELVYSGEGGILNMNVLFDINFGVN